MLPVLQQLGVALCDIKYSLFYCLFLFIAIIYAQITEMYDSILISDFISKDKLYKTELIECDTL